MRFTGREECPGTRQSTSPLGESLETGCGSSSSRAFFRLFIGVCARGRSPSPPDPSTISRTRRLLSLEAHQAVFTWVLQQLAGAGLLRGKTVGIDATTLEANAALRSIVRPRHGRGLHGVPDAAGRSVGYSDHRRRERLIGAGGSQRLHCRVRVEGHASRVARPPLREVVQNQNLDALLVATTWSRAVRFAPLLPTLPASLHRLPLLSL